MLRQEDAKVTTGPAEKVGLCAFGAGCGDELGEALPLCAAGFGSLEQAGAAPLVDGAGDEGDDICGRAWAAAGMVGLVVLVMAVAGLWTSTWTRWENQRRSAQGEQSVQRAVVALPSAGPAIEAVPASASDEGQVRP